MEKNNKIDDLTEKERKAWEEKLKYMEGDTMNSHKITTIKQGRGWIF